MSQLPGRGHAISCWRYPDPNISTHHMSSDDGRLLQVPNLLDLAPTDVDVEDEAARPTPPVFEEAARLNPPVTA